MLAAADLLEMLDKVAEAAEYFRIVLADTEAGRAAPDRFSFDPKNKVTVTPGQHGHGSRMISLGGLAMAGEILGDDEWFKVGERFIRYVVDHHINRGQLKGLQLYDFVESIDDAGDPWLEDGRVLSDPGHSLEFIGLAGKFLLVLRDKPSKTASQEQLLQQCAELFPKVLAANFRNGYNPQVGGICKAFDLLSRTPINSDMPWWSIPETMRAAAELLHLCPAADHSETLQVIADCSNGFVRRFVNRKVHLMAYQTVDETGKPIDVIPATPDADPGYHTGLSIIDFLDCIQSIWIDQ
jgi:mannose/cellobiose epimerase-like protein (N-acyl-D-glucosamine 2-epimerase family)